MESNDQQLDWLLDAFKDENSEMNTQLKTLNSNNTQQSQTKQFINPTDSLSDDSSNDEDDSMENILTTSESEIIESTKSPPIKKKIRNVYDKCLKWDNQKIEILIGLFSYFQKISNNRLINTASCGYKGYWKLIAASMSAHFNVNFTIVKCRKAVYNKKVLHNSLYTELMSKQYDENFLRSIYQKGTQYLKNLSNENNKKKLKVSKKISSNSSANFDDNILSLEKIENMGKIFDNNLNNLNNNLNNNLSANSSTNLPLKLCQDSPIVNNLINSHTPNMMYMSQTPQTAYPLYSYNLPLIHNAQYHNQYSTFNQMDKDSPLYLVQSPQLNLLHNYQDLQELNYLYGNQNFSCPQTELTLNDQQYGNFHHYNINDLSSKINTNIEGKKTETNNNEDKNNNNLIPPILQLQLLFQNQNKTRYQDEKIEIK